MALTLNSAPETRAFFGEPMLFQFTSDLFPTPSAETARTISYSDVTSSGFWRIGVTTSAVNLTAGRYIVFTVSGKTYTARILAVSTTVPDTSYRYLTLNIPNPGVSAGVTTVKRYYFGYAIQLQLFIGQPTYAATYTEVIESTTGTIDIAPVLSRLWQRYLAAFDSVGRSLDQLTYRYQYREIWADSTPSYSSLSGDHVALPGSLLPQQSIEQFELEPLSTRPVQVEAVEGQIVPFVVLPETSGTNFIRQSFGLTIDDVIQTGLHASGSLFTIASGRNTLQLRNLSGALSSPFDFVARCRKDLDIEFLWRNNQGQFDSYVFTLVRENVGISKDKSFRSNTRAAALTLGNLGAYERSYASTDAEISWTITSGKVGQLCALWLSEMGQSNEVYYRDGLKYYRVIIQPSSNDVTIRGTTYPEVVFVVIGSAQAGLQKPRPLNEAMVEDTAAIFSAYCEANSFTEDSAACFADTLTELTAISI